MPVRHTSRDAGRHLDITVQRQAERIRLQIFLSSWVTEVAVKRIFCGETKRVQDRTLRQNLE